MSKKNKHNDNKVEEQAAAESQAAPQAEEVKEEAAQQAEEPAADQQAAKQVEEMQGKLAEANDRYLRLAAEFDNYRRRTAKERMDLIALANENLVKDMLPIIDDFERALAAMKDSDDSASAKEGTELIYNKMVAFLKKNGVVEIDALGKEFDTDFHEAVAQFPVEEKKKKNTVIDVTQKGYTMGEKVIRYAKVVIGI
ncbi:MAG: nucleotide exchange factor GrpE [Bacteroidales bacterium]|nr:nucleotide exchange factor GrpE [Bacteroidales bacterium]MBO7479894.1 nucleotide exchange factor GrpE [Bacteroidales bacterium]MBO7488129.1 nucleotide exchange factor GrpE [Bacteroidales bacterium]